MYLQDKYSKINSLIDTEILQLDDKIGTLEVGKLALLDCAFVMKDGIVYETEKCEDMPA